MSALAMKIAWQLFRAKYGMIPFHAKAFSICLRHAWHAVRGGKFVAIDMRPMSERGHMYQDLA